MPYVRTHGNQISIVHGERNKETGKVLQRELFTLYSKKEAAAALGDTNKEDSRYFEQLLSVTNPQIEFDWPDIKKEIRLRLDLLPDVYPERKARLGETFEESLFNFARQLVITDPLNSKVGRETLNQYSRELSTLQKIISLRQQELTLHIDRPESPFDFDDRFCWRYELLSHTMPLGMEEFVDDLRRAGNHAEAKPLYALLMRCFPEYAEGYNSLGLIALDENDPNQAVEHFRNTVKYGRKRFPRKIAKEDYWRDLETRPYLRGLMNLALALNMAGQFKEALSICDQIIKESGRIKEDSAWAHRASAYLNLLDWENAADAALKIAKTCPDEGFVLGYALFELGRYKDCIQWFLHASLNSPHSAHLLLDKAKPKPRNFAEVEDHNAGITLLRSLPRFYKMQSKASSKFFKKLSENSQVKALLSEVMKCQQKHFDQKNNKNRECFDRWHELKEFSFARKKAQELLNELSAERVNPSPK